MTTYVLGAGASFHAGYPLCSELWPWMVTWVTETHPPDSEYRQAIDAVATLNGPVLDVEGVFTDLDLGRGAFRTLTEDQQNRLNGRLRRCLADYFKSICRQQREAPLYVAFANRVEKGDVVITFNYDVSLENELIRAHKFRVRNGWFQHCHIRLRFIPIRLKAGAVPVSDAKLMGPNQFILKGHVVIERYDYIALLNSIRESYIERCFALLSANALEIVCETTA